jgi:hypothetical protein
VHSARPFTPRYLSSTPKSDKSSTASSSGLWRERQLRDYRRANGLCYFCGEKYDALNQLEMEDVLVQDLCQLSLHALAGTESADSMRVRALVGNQVFLILIDSGSSHSFVISSFVNRLNLPITALSPLTVKVANGDTLISDAVVKHMQWWTAGHTFTHDMRVLDLSAYDAILGFDWLKSHSPMLCDWNAKSLTFQDMGVVVTLKGVSKPQLHLQELPAEQFLKWSKGNDIWSVAILNTLSSFPLTDVPQPVARLLQDYQDIFGESLELPPQREYDPAISLFPDSRPVNSRPYRYSPLHKDEIERQVKEL